jgi:hypothetical protein
MLLNHVYEYPRNGVDIQSLQVMKLNDKEVF